jgi:transcriptional regulator with XRE-family HTH domain
LQTIGIDGISLCDMKKPAKKKELPDVIKRLKQWRAQNDLSQRQAMDVMAARGLPISLTSLQNYEGAFRTPSASANYAIARFLDDHPVITDAPVYPRRDPLPDDKVAEILALRERGWELLRIAEKFGISESSVSLIVSGRRRKRKPVADSGQN